MRVRRIQTDVYPKGHHLRAELIAPTESLFETLDLLRNVLLGVVPLMLLVAGLGGLVAQPSGTSAGGRDDRGRGDVEHPGRLRATCGSADRRRVAKVGEAWNRMLDRIAASVQQMTRFTMDAARELRTPAAIIHSSAELALRRERSPDEYREALRAIEEESARLTSMVQDLLALAPVRVQVRDRGPGIAAEDLPHIFKRFYRANSARSGPGSGLGLAIAKAIVDEHEGTISLRSTPPQQGTIATIGLRRT